MQVDRSSGTLIEYPVVADVDNDGAAEVLVVSNENFDGRQLTPTLQVIRDSEDRWIQARRIWNQHTYHVTNINEDGDRPRRRAAELAAAQHVPDQRADRRRGGVCTARRVTGDKGVTPRACC